MVSCLTLLHYFTLILSIQIAYQQPQTPSCTAFNNYITLGDAFSPQSFPDRTSHHPTDDIYTIGFSVVGTCNDIPQIQLSNSSSTLLQSQETMLILPYLSDFYTYTFENRSRWDKVPPNTNPGDKYVRTSYHFKIKSIMLEQYDTWQIFIDKKTQKESFRFPDASRYSKDKTNKQEPLKIAIVADMDHSKESKPVIDYLNTNAKKFDAYMHIGDFAYNIEDSCGLNGDNFWDLVSPTSSSIPYLIVAGNHEDRDHAKFFNYRFRMPGGNDDMNTRNHMYSYDIRDTHWVGINIDSYYYDSPEDRQTGLMNMIDWINQDLKKARESKDYKFIIQFSHRPIFCGEQKSVDCWGLHAYFKVFEDLLWKYRVDQVLQAHVHDYTRLSKFRNYEFLGSSTLTKGDEYKGPVYIVSGHSGTSHYYPLVKFEGVSKILNEVWKVGSDPYYLELVINDDSLVGSLVDAVTFEVADRFEIWDQRSMGMGPDDKNWWIENQWWVLILAGMFVIANVIMIVNIVMRKRQRMKKIAVKLNKDLHVEVDKGKLIAEQNSDLL